MATSGDFSWPPAGTSTGHQWILSHGHGQSIALWANSSHEERANISELANFLDLHQDVPLVTWNGNSADIPKLRKVAQDHGLSDTLRIDSRLHVDLYLWVKRNIRLPIPDLSIKAVGEYFGFPRVSAGMDGLQAVGLYLEYCASHDQRIKDRLCDYNRDDVDSLIHVSTKLQELSSRLDHG